jgi:hypothetical protein
VQTRPPAAQPGNTRGHPAQTRPADGTDRVTGATRPMTVDGIVSGRRQASAVSTRAAGSAGFGRMDAGGVRLRLRALHVMGHGSARIARAVGASEQAIQKITRGQATTVRPSLRDAVTAVYDAWWDKRAPERTRGERAAATAARRRAITGNWCAGAGLDDDQLDIPGYQPAWGWRPAQGTGTATDIGPRAQEEEMGLGA